jgi:hypothetical protein
VTLDFEPRTLTLELAEGGIFDALEKSFFVMGSATVKARLERLATVGVPPTASKFPNFDMCLSDGSERRRGFRPQKFIRGRVQTPLPTRRRESASIDYDNLVDILITKWHFSPSCQDTTMEGT